MYQVIAKPRTGSSLLNLYTIEDNDGLGYSEFFLNRYLLLNQKVYVDETCDLTKSPWDSDSVEEKFDYLNFYKKQDVHFAIKIFPYHLIRLGFEEQLRDYLQGYKLLTIDRDPFDQFLSFAHQSNTSWKQPHLYTPKDEAISKSYSVGKTSVLNFCERYHIETEFINSLEFTKRFDYNQINKEYLQQFFNTKYKPVWQPFDLDYISEIDNLREVMQWFNERISNVI